MTRRLALVIASVVIATLVLAGLGTIVVGNVRARHTTEVELRRQATEVATNLDQVLDNSTTTDNPAALRRRLRLLNGFRRALKLDGLAFLTVRNDGTLTGDDLPGGLTLDQLPVGRLANLHPVSGNSGNLVFAAAPARLPNGGVIVVVVSRQANSGLTASLRTFILAGLATLAIGVGVAVILGRRLARPIREASEAAMGIARGELSTRLPQPPPQNHDELSELARSVNAMATELERARVLDRFRSVLMARRIEVATAICRENGKPVGEALATEILVALDYAAYFARLAPKALAPRSVAPATMSMLLKKVRLEVLPALVAGNAVVLKPSEFTPTSGVLLVELLREAGVPEHVVSVLPGDGITGAALVGAGVNRVSFTGSVATGRKVAGACAAQLIPCSLELGGSDPAIVLDDADVERAARGIVWGRFSNAGQTCVAPKRVFVEAAVFDTFTAAISRQVRALHVGAGGTPGTEVGPMIRPAAVTELRAQLDDALARGAVVAAAASLGDRSPESWFVPTVVTNVTSEMRVLREETFGPLLPLVKVESEDDAVRRANASEFGLSASVWSGDRRRAERVASRLEAGTVAINDAVVVAGMANVPHGGVKASGLGRSHGEQGLMECVESRAIVSDRFAMARQPWWFGYGTSHVDDADGLVLSVHGRSIGEQLRGTWRLLRAALGARRSTGD